jgi:hypothetical protein
VSLFFDKLDVAIKGQTRCRVTRSGYPGEKATINQRNPNGGSERRNGKLCNPFGVEMAMVTLIPG